jgi:uncharacterized protein (DUF488 family)
VRRLIYTVGHSNHSLAKFLALIASHEIAAVADVRSFPGSRRWPHFNREDLAATLERVGVEYRWMPELGGRNKATRALSPHTAWTTPGFRAYADYMDTEEFAAALDALAALAADKATGFMCSEGLSWQCHRRMIADALVVRAWDVRHIMPDGKLVEHTLAKFARVAGDGRIVYDGVADEQL